MTFSTSVKTHSSGTSATPSTKRSQSIGSSTPGGVVSLGGMSTVLQNTVNLQQPPGGREGGVAVGEEEIKKEKLLNDEVEDSKGLLATQQLLEKAALAGLSKST